MNGGECSSQAAKAFSAKAKGALLRSYNLLACSSALEKIDPWSKWKDFHASIEE